MSNLDQAVVLITGASGGFGLEFTRQLLQAGSFLILTDQDEKILRERVEVIRHEVSTGKILAYFANDLSTREGCKSLYEQVKALGLSLDILINNAGIGLFGRMDEVPAEKWEKLMEVNLIAPMRLSSLFAADMIAEGKGHIVNISSLSGWWVPPGMAHYGASKYGLRGLSEGLFQELKTYNVKVTGVYPFFSRTPILQSERYGSLGQEIQEFPENIATNPTDVIRATLKGIINNKLYVFPDMTAKTVQILNRYFPQLLNCLSESLIRRLKRG